MRTGTETPLKRILNEEGRKQSWLAEQVGLSRTQMNNIVNGLHCSDTTAAAIATALRRNVDELFPPEIAA